MKRREFITRLGVAATIWPLAARAQQPEQIRRIGVLMGYPEAQSEFASFVQELQKLGWAEGRNLRTDVRWGIPADPGSMHRFAKELVALQYSPTSFFHKAHPLLRRCFRKRVPSRSFSRLLPIRWAAVLSQASRGPAAMPPASSSQRARWGANGLNCSRKSRRGSPASPPCLILLWRHMPIIG